MDNESKLPFQITYRNAERGMGIYIASLKGTKVSARYALGDDKRRHEVADSWMKDKRLLNKRKVRRDDIEHELNKAEMALMVKLDDISKSKPTAANTIERGSYIDDERIVELAWNTELGEVDFIIFDRATGEVSRSQFAEVPAGSLIVPTIARGIVTPGFPVEGSVFVPSEWDGSGVHEDKLRQSIETFINRYVELPAGSLAIAVEYVLLTWVYDVFDELLYLAFRTADIGRGKSRGLDTVGALCYRPMFVGGGSSAAATLRMLDTFGGTLVADEFDAVHNTDMASDLNRILNQGFQRCRPLVKCDGESNAPRAFRCFGPKLFALRKRLGDDATESRALCIRMGQRTRDDIPLNLPRQQFDHEALAIRNKLLAWRLANLGRVKINPALASPDLEDRANQIGLPLLSVAKDDTIRQRIVAALKEQQGAVAMERSASWAGEVLTVILATVQAGGTIRPGDIATEMNRRRAAQAGIDVEKLGKQLISAHKAGRIIGHELELPHDDPSKDNQGARYRLDPARMAQLCRRFGLTIPGTSQRSQHHSSVKSSREKLVGDRAREVRDISDDNDVSAGGRGVPGGRNVTTEHPASRPRSGGRPSYIGRRIGAKR